MAAIFGTRRLSGGAVYGLELGDAAIALTAAPASSTPTSSAAQLTFIAPLLVAAGVFAPSASTATISVVPSAINLSAAAANILTTATAATISVVSGTPMTATQGYTVKAGKRAADKGDVQRFPVKDPLEDLVLCFSFTEQFNSIADPTLDIGVFWAATESTGDISPSDVLDGGFQIDGSTVLQRVKAGVHLVDYSFRCTVTGPDGVTRLSLPAILPVRTLP